MSRVFSHVDRAAIFLAGIVAGTVTNRRGRNGIGPAAKDLKESIADLERRLAARESPAADRFRKIEARLDEHASRLANGTSTSQIVAAMEEVFARTMSSLDERLSTQAFAIDVLKSAVANTDDLLERVLCSIDSLQAATDAASPSVAEEASNIPGSVLEVGDDTEPKPSNPAQLDEGARLRLALDASRAGIWEWDVRTGEGVWSEEVWRLYGLEPNCLQPSYAAWRELVHPESRPLAEQVVQEAVRDGREINVEFRIQERNGNTPWLLALGLPLCEADGTVARFIGIVADVTERKCSEASQREVQRLESLGLLAGGVAHDFNNLLVVVIGNASIAQEMLPPGHPAAELLDGVLKTGEEAAQLTRQMLAYSGRGRFMVEKLNLSALISELSGLVRPTLSRRIDIRLDLDPDLASIEADRGQVQQAFTNLALNAAEAIGGQEGQITLRTGVQQVDEPYLRLHPELATLRPGRYVFLEVRDTGCGMDEATKAKVFDPFFSTKFAGRGLGLAAVAGIVRGHKGAIAVSSAPGKGSCFTVLFPALERAAPEVPAAPVLEESVSNAITVLVVDDEEVVRNMATKVLERHGYQVLTAASGSEAIDMCRRHAEIAAVVLDLSAPGIRYEEVLPKLRQARPSAKILISSGYSEAEAARLFPKQGISGFIQKPYSSKGLVEKLKASLG